jgi:hypothetical protein
MKRRDFLKTSLAVSTFAGVNAVGTGHAAESASTPAREFYELRRYHLRRGPKQTLFDEFFKNAAIPAANRAGLNPIGVFNVMVGNDSPTAYVLIPYRSGDEFVTASDRVLADAEYQKAGAEFINASPGEPAYIRVESSFMVAFGGMPKLEVPDAIRGKGSRLFELRIYESHSKRANKKKIEMFDIGEIALFRRAGLHPVFFGETLIGDKVPNLTYLLGYENMEARDKAWRAFGSDPEWKKLSSTPGYTDPEIVSNISNAFLRPAAYSQI